MNRDRHGRARRADADRLRRPPDGFRVRDRQRFRSLVEDVLPTLPEPLRAAVSSSGVVVFDVPPPGTADLARWDPSAGKVVVYRRAVEGRALGRVDLQQLVRAAIGRAVAEKLGRADEFEDEWDDDWDDG